MQAPFPELLEALGACLVVLGLVFLSLPVGLIAAGVYLVAVANMPGVDTPVGSDGHRRGVRRAEAKR